MLMNEGFTSTCAVVLPVLAFAIANGAANVTKVSDWTQITKEQGKIRRWSMQTLYKIYWLAIFFAVFLFALGELDCVDALRGGPPRRIESAFVETLIVAGMVIVLCSPPLARLLPFLRDTPSPAPPDRPPALPANRQESPGTPRPPPDSPPALPANRQASPGTTRPPPDRPQHYRTLAQTIFAFPLLAGRRRLRKDDQAELVRLRKENGELAAECDILRRTVALWVKNAKSIVGDDLDS